MLSLAYAPILVKGNVSEMQCDDARKEPDRDSDGEGKCTGRRLKFAAQSNESLSGGCIALGCI